MAIKRSAFPFALAPREAVAGSANTHAEPTDATELRFDEAMRRFETGRWDLAFAELSVLANRGHPAAARIALMLARRGTSLFGGPFAATREEQAQWGRNGDS